MRPSGTHCKNKQIASIRHSIRRGISTKASKNHSYETIRQQNATPAIASRCRINYEYTRCNYIHVSLEPKGRKHISQRIHVASFPLPGETAYGNCSCLPRLPSCATRRLILLLRAASAAPLGYGARCAKCGMSYACGWRNTI